MIDFLDAHPELTLTTVLITHGHFDHVEGLSLLKQRYRIRVFASHLSKVEGVTDYLTEGDLCETPLKDCQIMAIEVPGHTSDHLAYVEKGTKALFSGDTLFSCGCGRIFDSTPALMYDSLQRLASLPDDAQVYAAHEYTDSNIQFAKRVEPDSSALLAREQAVLALREKGLPTLPVSIETERQTNPFLRVDQPAIIERVSQHAKRALKDPVSVFTALREWKNRG